MSFQAALSFFTLSGLFLICLTATTVKPKWGPYTTTAVGLKPCAKPSQPYLKDPILRVAAEISKYKKNVMKGNLTILKDTNNVKVSIKEFYYEEGKWQMTFNVKNFSCRSQLVTILMEIFDVMYDSKTCIVPKGTYAFEVDYNKVDHSLMASRDYGRMLRRIEASTKAGTVFCLEFEEIVGPETH